MKGPTQERVKHLIEALRTRAGGKVSRLDAEARDAVFAATGFSPHERDDIEQAGFDRLTRGQGYLKNDMTAEAIDELSQAALLLGDHLEALHHLALAHQRRWTLEQRHADRAHAERLARWCLELTPDHGPSFSLLSQLKHPHVEGAPSSPPPTDAGPMRGIIAVALAALVAVGALGCIGALVLSLTARQTSAPDPPRASVAAEEAPASDKGDEEVRLTFRPGDQGHGLEWELRGSTIARYAGGKAFYRLQGLVHNKGQTGLDTLKLELALKDAQGKVILRKQVMGLGTHQARALPGDAIPIHHLIQTPPEVTSATLSIVEARTTLAPATPGDKLLPLAWGKHEALGVELEVTERALKTNVNSLKNDGEFFHDAEVVFAHKGTEPINTLKIQITYLDSDGAVTDRAERYIVSTMSPPMLAGDRRVVRLLVGVPARTTDYRLEVVDLR